MDIVYPYNEIFDKKKRMKYWYSYTMDVAQKHYAQWKKPPSV